jgi:plasmid stability protein
VTDLTIHNLDPAVTDRLAARAAERGTTVEGEARAILEQAVTRPDLADLALELFGPKRGVELKLPPRHPLRTPPGLE